MTYIIPFTRLGKNNIPIAGGKGANLGEMTAAGFPVPPGFVLTTEAYDAFVQAHGLQQQIVDLASQVSTDRPQLSEVASEKIKTLFLAADMSDEITEAVLSAYGDMENGAVAVRSSATAEDLPTVSFAGQQDTYLNIQGDDALLEAVKKCWASLWTARAISYRLRQGIDPADVSLAVVVQQFVSADSAGILFTANPIDGERDQIIINATWGLGEAIVSGQVTPDTVVVDKSNRQILSRETATKTTMTVRTDTGTEEQPVPPAQQNQAVLNDAAAIKLARYGAQIEAHYEMPMDIEWAISGGKIAILQARPITNLPPAPLRDVRWEPPQPGTVWMRRQVVEHMPEPLSPLFDELYVREGLAKSIDNFFKMIGGTGDVNESIGDLLPQGFATTVNGYAYSAASATFKWNSIPKVLQIYVMILRYGLPNWRDDVLPAYLAAVGRWKGIDLADTSDEELLRGVRELTTAEAIYWFASDIPLAIARITTHCLMVC